MTSSDEILLWVNSGGKCNYPNCRIDLIIESENKANIGEIAHIISKSNQGPRYIPNLDNYNIYDNLILLCRNHHKIVDVNTDKWTIENLKNMKQNHLKWVETHPNEIKPKKVLENEFNKYVLKVSWFANEILQGYKNKDWSRIENALNSGYMLSLVESFFELSK